ncbi:MAG: nitroreductase family protein [Desulfobacterales bacterium]|nr:nitroreductase family protein [Desulfobacterales bacterium]
MLNGEVNSNEDSRTSLDKIIDERRSIRKYKTDMPPLEWIDKMIYSATRAPSPSNSQPVRFIRISSNEIKNELSQAMAFGKQTFLNALEGRDGIKRIRNWINAYYRFSEFMFSVPVLFAVGTVMSVSGFSEKLLEAGLMEKNEKKDTELDISVGLALKGAILKGEELGLGSCILTAPLAFITDIEEIIGIADVRIKCLLTVGFPDEVPRTLDKKNVSDIYSEI